MAADQRPNIEFRESLEKKGVLFEEFGNEFIFFDPEEMSQYPTYGVIVRLFNALERDINGHLSRRIGSITREEYAYAKSLKEAGRKILGSITIYPVGKLPGDR